MHCDHGTAHGSTMPDDHLHNSAVKSSRFRLRALSTGIDSAIAWNSAPRAPDRFRWCRAHFTSWGEISPSPSQSRTSKAYRHSPSPWHLLLSTAAAKNSVYSTAPLPLTSMPSKVFRSSSSESSKPLSRMPSRSSRGDSRPSPSASSATNALRRAPTSASSSRPATMWSTALKNASCDPNLRKFATTPQGRLAASGLAWDASHACERACAAVGLLSGSLQSRLDTNSLVCAEAFFQCGGQNETRPSATLSSTLCVVWPRNGRCPHAST
mmetsp:Transcript_8293/g.22132  ORF Transcript_8293/g.22132 Transcript_8293/m.22132 type:complete len:268 (+) Transcript_8293:767-1570(+)